MSGHAAELPSELRPLHSYLAESGEQPDLLKAKLLIDRAIDPATDADAITRRIDDLAVRVRSRFPAGATRRTRLELLMSSIYEPGPWNDDRPFAYDLDDPLGRNPRAKLLESYLETRRGNCVSMPILLAILGRRLDLPVTLAVAPLHVLVTLMEHYGRARPTERLATADLALSLDSRDVDALLHAGTAFAVLGDAIKERYPDPADLPVELHETVRHLQQTNLGLFAHAEALGWVEPTAEQTAAYLQSVEREKTNRGGKR